MTIVSWACAIIGIAVAVAFATIVFATALESLEETEIGGAIIDKMLKKIKGGEEE